MALIERAADRDGEHGDDSVAFLLSSPINPETFSEELRALFNSSDEVPVLIFEGDVLPREASEDHPLVMWVLDGFVTIEHLQQVLEAHDPQVPDYESDEAFLSAMLERSEEAGYSSIETVRILRTLMRRSTP